MYLGIDAGGTHTDAAVIENGRVLATAKVVTNHEDLPSSVAGVLRELSPSVDLRRVRRVTLGTTLAINAIVQGRTDAVGLALTAGPGIAPQRFAMGEYVHVAAGGLDHRGVEVAPLDTASLRKTAAAWREAGVGVFAVAGKFSPRNPAHEQGLAAVLEPLGHVTQGHQLSALLNFPRRIAGAWYNSAVWRLHNRFLDAVEQSLRAAGVTAPVRLLKADGGAAALELSRRHPVDSILSGPAASVMGVMALCRPHGDSLLLDMGGTTTDMALYAEGSPVLDRQGMRLVAAGQERCTPVRALAAQSLGVGGDSRITITAGKVAVGPWRDGPAMAFGGSRPTLLDACNTLGTDGSAGQSALSRRGMEELARANGMDTLALAREVVSAAAHKVAQGVRRLLDHVNGHPVYTLAALLENRRIQPAETWLVGGPASLMRRPLEEALGLPVQVPHGAATANAVGAALTLPTAELELLADTTQGIARVPALDWERPINRKYGLADARQDALEQLRAYAAAQDETVEQAVEVLEADMFATLDDGGYGGKDIRVRCQLTPGIVSPVCL